MLKLPHQVSLIISSCAATQFALFSIIPIFYVDKVGRRKTIIFGSLGCAIAMGCIAGGVSVNTKLGAAVAIAFMFLFDDCHALGVHAVAWFYACEINSLYLPLPPSLHPSLHFMLAPSLHFMLAPSSTRSLESNS